MTTYATDGSKHDDWVGLSFIFDTKTEFRGRFEGLVKSLWNLDSCTYSWEEILNFASIHGNLVFGLDQGLSIGLSIRHKDSSAESEPFQIQTCSIFFFDSLPEIDEDEDEWQYINEDLELAAAYEQRIAEIRILRETKQVRPLVMHQPTLANRAQRRRRKKSGPKKPFWVL